MPKFAYTRRMRFHRNRTQQATNLNKIDAATDAAFVVVIVIVVDVTQFLGEYRESLQSQGYARRVKWKGYRYEDTYT